jgi:DHA1 family tetracycline resistance protein-like MFS transporter
MTKNKSAYIVIFLTVFIDLLGFGIVIPLMPDFLKNQMHESESLIGIVVGIFSLMQFIFTPVWGSFSDIYGRKKILIISLAGNVISYLMMTLVFSGIVQSVMLLLVSRAFAGIFSGNIAAAQSAMSDVTTIENRSKGMGIIGAAFGLGFLFGPAMGGFLSAKFGYGIPILLSAAFSMTALLFCLTIFKETLPDDLKHLNKSNFKGATIINFKAIKDLLTHKKVGMFVIIFFIITFSYANTYATFLLFVERPDGLHLGTESTSYLLSYMGIIAAIVQGFTIKFFKKRLGEERSVLVGNIFMIIGLAATPFCTTILQLLIILTILSFGNGLNTPMVMGYISMNVGRDEQGSILGINQALGSLARFFGPIWGGFAYQYFGYHSPFLSGAIILLIISVIGFNYMWNRSPVIAEDQ